MEFAFRKLEFNTIYYTYSNNLPFKYYISILGGGVGCPELGKTCLYNTCTLPKKNAQKHCNSVECDFCEKKLKGKLKKSQEIHKLCFLCRKILKNLKE